MEVHEPAIQVEVHSSGGITVSWAAQLHSRAGFLPWSVVLFLRSVMGIERPFLNYNSAPFSTVNHNSYIDGTL